MTTAGVLEDDDTDDTDDTDDDLFDPTRRCCP